MKARWVLASFILWGMEVDTIAQEGNLLGPALVLNGGGVSLTSPSKDSIGYSFRATRMAIGADILSKSNGQGTENIATMSAVSQIFSPSLYVTYGIGYRRQFHEIGQSNSSKREMTDYFLRLQSQTVGINFGLSSFRSLPGGIFDGVDWFSIYIPIKSLQRQITAIRLTDEEIEIALSSMERPTGIICRIVFGISI